MSNFSSRLDITIENVLKESLQLYENEYEQSNDNLMSTTSSDKNDLTRNEFQQPNEIINSLSTTTP